MTDGVLSLKQHRIARGLSVRGLVERVREASPDGTSVGRQTIIDLEAGKKGRPSTYHRLAQALDIDPMEIREFRDLVSEAGDQPELSREEQLAHGMVATAISYAQDPGSDSVLAEEGAEVDERILDLSKTVNVHYVEEELPDGRKRVSVSVTGLTDETHEEFQQLVQEAIDEFRRIRTAEEAPNDQDSTR